MVSSSGLSCRSSPRISAPICLVSGTTSSPALVIATIDGIEAEKTAGELQNDGVLPAGGTPAERFLTRVKKESRSGEETLVRAAPADAFAPRFSLACRARRRLCYAPHAAQVGHYGKWEIARASGGFHSVYEAAEQVGHA